MFSVRTTELVSQLLEENYDFPIAAPYDFQCFCSVFAGEISQAARACKQTAWARVVPSDVSRKKGTTLLGIPGEQGRVSYWQCLNMRYLDARQKLY